MEEPSINYGLIFKNFSQKIKDMRVGSIKRSGIKKIAKPVCYVPSIQRVRLCHVQRYFVQHKRQLR